jgi:hypothetical protein
MSENVEYTPRLFIYENEDREFNDPGAAITNEQMLAHLARTYPQLAKGEIEVGEVVDGLQHVVFKNRPKTLG